MINPWQTLGVHRGSTAEEIKAAYRNVQRNAHPDMGGSAEQSAAAAEAYALLSSRKALLAYLNTALAVLKLCGLCKGKGYTFKSKGLTGRTTTSCTGCGGRGLV